MWLIISFGFIISLLKFGTDRIFTTAKYAYWVLMFLLFIQVLARFKVINTSYIPNINGAYAWYVIPKIGSFQPSEFMKVMIIFLTANIIYEHNQEKEDLSFSSDLSLVFKLARLIFPF